MPQGSDPIQYGLPAEAVEDVSARAGRAKHFRHPDGSRTAVLGAAPLHYQAVAGGPWLDPSEMVVQRSAPGTWTVTTSEISIQANYSAMTLTYLPTNQSWQWVFQGASVGPAGEIVYNGVPWQYEPSPWGVKSHAVVAARRGPQVYQWIYTTNTTPVVDAEGNIRTERFLIPRPFVLGADGERYECGGWELAWPYARFSFDDGDLPDVALPYVIDPSTDILSGSVGMVYSESSTYSTARSGGTLTATAGTLFVGQTRSGASYRCYETFLAFDLSGIPGDATVTGATLKTTIFLGNAGTAFTMEARADAWGPSLMTGDWVSGADLSSLTLLASLSTDNAVDYNVGYSAFASEAALVTATSGAIGATLEMVLSSSRHRGNNLPSGSEYVQILASSGYQPTLTVAYTEVGSLSGAVTDASTNAPLENVAVSVVPDVLPPPAFVAAGAIDRQTSGGTLSLAYPAGIDDDDLLLALVSTQAESSTLATPSGWTLVGNAGSVGSDCRTWVFRRWVDGSESGSLSLTPSDSTARAGVVVAYRGVDPTTPIDGWDSADSLTAPSVSAGENQSQILRFYRVGGNQTFSPLSGHVARTQGAIGPTIALFDRAQADSGSTGTATATASASNRAQSLTLVLNPAPPDPIETETGASGEYLIGDVNPGDYTATYSKTNYVTQQKTIEIEAGEETVQNVALVAAALRPAAARILVAGHGAHLTPGPVMLTPATAHISIASHGARIGYPPQTISPAAAVVWLHGHGATLASGAATLRPAAAQIMVTAAGVALRPGTITLSPGHAVLVVAGTGARLVPRPAPHTLPGLWRPVVDVGTGLYVPVITLTGYWQAVVDAGVAYYTPVITLTGVWRPVVMIGDAMTGRMSASSIPANLALTPGEARTFRWHIADSETGLPLDDMDGWTVKLFILYHVRDLNGVADLAAQALLAKSASIDAPYAIFAFSATDTAELPIRNLAYELWRTDSGDEARLAYGAFPVIP